MEDDNEWMDEWMDDDSIDRLVHPFQELRKPQYRGKKNRMEADDEINLCIAYLKTADSCKQWSVPNKKIRMKYPQIRRCHCIEFLSEDDQGDQREAVAKYMMLYFEKSKPHKQQIIMEWLRYTEDSTTACRFLLPVCDREYDVTINNDEAVQEFSNKVTALRSYKVCKSAIGFILGINKDAWNTCQKAVKKNMVPQHGNRYQRSGRGRQFDGEIKDDLMVFLEGLKSEAEPQSTRVVRDLVGGTTLRDTDEDVVYLSVGYSKRMLYTTFCHIRGHTLQLSPKGYSVINVADDAQLIPSWKTFCKFWKLNYPKLRIGSAGEDICTDCHNYQNRFKSAAARKARMEGQEEEEDSLDEDDWIGASYIDKKKRKLDEATSTDALNEIEAPTEQEAPIEQEVYDMKTKTYADVECEAVENTFDHLVGKAALHVSQAKDQRRLCNLKIAEAEEDFAAGVPHIEARRCIVVDYSQNVQIPQVGASQPGKTYYMSPIKVFIFGIVNCSVAGGTLDAYIYHEGQGAKGGNNVASLIMLFLEQRGWLGDPLDKDPGHELTIIMDNCPGQNKNNTVLRLPLLLVEAGYFHKVNCMFYIVGHTKNVCDRWFNTLKKKYRTANLYILEHLKEALSTHDRISVNQVLPEEFKGYTKFLNLYYTPIAAGICKPGHIFTCEAMTPTVMTIHKDDLGTSEPHVQSFAITRIGMTHGDRLKNLRERLELETLVAPGIPEIKQVDLYRKWRKIVPSEYWVATCPTPSPAVLERHKKKDAAKRLARVVAFDPAKAAAKAEKKNAAAEKKAAAAAARQQKELVKARKKAAATAARAEKKAVAEAKKFAKAEAKIAATVAREEKKAEAKIAAVIDREQKKLDEAATKAAAKESAAITKAHEAVWHKTFSKFKSI